MKFEKGHKKLGGRKKGVSNKDTSKIRSAFAEILNGNIEKVETELNKLEGAAYINAVIAIANQVLPKLQSIDADVLTHREIFITVDE